MYAEGANYKQENTNKETHHIDWKFDAAFRLMMSFKFTPIKYTMDRYDDGISTWQMITLRLQLANVIPYEYTYRMIMWWYVKWADAAIELTLLCLTMSLLAKGGPGYITLNWD